jgi:hypothetical protein
VRNPLYGHSQEVRSGAARKLRSSRKMQQWWRQKNKELVNSKNQSLPLIKLPVKGAHEAEAVSPLTGRKTIKLLRCPCATVSVQSNRTHSDSLNDITSVKLLKNKKSGYDSMIMAIHRKFSNSLKCYSTHRC